MSPAPGSIQQHLWNKWVLLTPFSPGFGHCWAWNWKCTVVKPGVGWPPFGNGAQILGPALKGLLILEAQARSKILSLRVLAVESASLANSRWTPRVSLHHFWIARSTAGWHRHASTYIPARAFPKAICKPTYSEVKGGGHYTNNPDVCEWRKVSQANWILMILVLSFSLPPSTVWLFLQYWAWGD